jgi:hypothetical protein
VILRAAALLALAAAFAGLVAGCGSGSGKESAGTFITRILNEEIDGQWGKQWDELNPGHQRLITRTQYILCSKGSPTQVGTSSATIDVKGTREAPLDVRGIAEHTATVVTVDLTPTAGAQPETLQLHVVRAGGRWTWILGSAALDALQHHKCPDGSRLPSP